MCNHSMLAPREYLGIFDTPDHEVYRCQCGVLINYRHPDNSEYPERPMSALEIEDMIQALIERIHTPLRDARDSISIACQMLAVTGQK